jgi:hypothetical protein
MTFWLVLYIDTDLRKEHSVPKLGLKQALNCLDPEDGYTTLLQKVDQITIRHKVTKGDWIVEKMALTYPTLLNRVGYGKAISSVIQSCLLLRLAQSV